MRCLVLLCLAATALAAPSMYSKEDHVYRLDLVPVSSTVIPLEDLEYTVGVGFNVHPNKESKYNYKHGKPSDLITAGGKKKSPQSKAAVKQLTKADFDRF